MTRSAASPKPIGVPEFDGLPKHVRRVALARLRLLRRWERLTQQLYGDRVQAAAKAVEEEKHRRGGYPTSVKSLYRWWKRHRRFGVMGLADLRWSHKKENVQ